MIGINIQKDISRTRKLEIKKGRTQIIIPKQKRRCPCGFIFKLLNGEIVVGGAMSGVDWPTEKDPEFSGPISRVLSWRRSKNGGQTWNKTLAWPTYAPYQFPDGEIIEISNRLWRIVNDQDTHNVAVFHSIDNGHTFKKERVPLFGMPKLAKLGGHHRERYANITHPIVRLHDGSLLVSAHGKFKNDIKERVFVIQSYDRGKTWNYLSTVAFDLI